MLSILSLLPVVGCDKASPVAPSGSILTISANPSQVALNGRSTITVVGRKPDGNPLNPGTEIRLTAERGSIDSVVTTDDSGRATATFRADGRAGEVMITAATGGGDTMAETSVQVGLSDTDRPNLILNVSPSTVPVNEDATITVVARNADGSSVGANQRIILTTTLGTITPDRPVTRADGTATATLQAGDQAGTATVTAILGSSEAATTMVTIRDAAGDIDLQPDMTSVPAAGGEITFTAFVTNTQGEPFQGAVVTFNSIGTFENGTTAFTDSSGVATKTITFTQEQLDGVEGNSFEVRASTPGPEGQLISDTSTVTIQGRPSGGG